MCLQPLNLCDSIKIIIHFEEIKEIYKTNFSKLVLILCVKKDVFYGDDMIHHEPTGTKFQPL